MSARAPLRRTEAVTKDGESWQALSWARRRLWNLVMDRFSEKPGRYEITLTRDDLLRAEVIRSDFDKNGRPKPYLPDSSSRSARGGGA